MTMIEAKRETVAKLDVAQEKKTFAELLRHLHRGGQWGHWVGKNQEATWWLVNEWTPVPDGGDAFYSVNPLRMIPPTNSKGQETEQCWIRSQVKYLAGINCVYAEIDGKDFVEVPQNEIEAFADQTEGAYATRQDALDAAKIELEAQMFKDNVARFKALALERVASWEPIPSAVVDSGGGYQAYWLLRNTFKFDKDGNLPKAGRLQRTWVESVAVGSDTGAKNLNRILRVAGTFNHKPTYGDPPPMVHFVKELTDLARAYSLKELEARVLEVKPDAFKVHETAVVDNGNVAQNIIQASQCMLRLSPTRCDDYGAWVEVGMILHKECGDAGLPLWDDWSKKSDKYKEGDCRAKWASFSADGGAGAAVGLGTLVTWAKEDSEARPKKQDESAPWQWRTLAQAYEPKEPRQYVVDRLSPLPSLSILFGPPGSLKTMLAMSKAVCVVSGQPWLEGLPGKGPIAAFGCQRAAVLWVDVDNGLDRTERRLAALGRAYGLPGNAPLYYISFPDPAFIANKWASVLQVVEFALAVDAKLIMFDNLGTISGGVDENSAQMIAVMSGLRRISEMTGAAVEAIHHPRKGGAGSGWAGDALRGHSSIAAAVDLALMIERGDDEYGSDAITLQCTKTRDVPVDPFKVLWTYEADGNELLKGKFYGLGEDRSKKDRAGRACDAVYDALADAPGLNQSTLVQAVKAIDGDLGVNWIRKAAEKLVMQGTIENKGSGTHKAYYLADKSAQLEREISEALVKEDDPSPLLGAVFD